MVTLSTAFCLCATRAASTAAFPPPDDYHRPPGQFYSFQVGGLQERQGLIDPFETLLPEVQLLALPGPRGKKYGLCPGGEEAVQGEIPAQRFLRMKGDIFVQEGIDLPAQGLLWQAVGGNGCHQHSPGFGRRFEDRNPVPLEGKEVGGG